MLDSNACAIGDRYRRWLACVRRTVCVATLMIGAACPAPSGAALSLPPAATPETVRVIPDPRGDYSAADVLAGRHDDGALPAPRADHHNLGYPRHPYWAVIDIDARESVPELLVLWRGSTHAQQVFERMRLADGRLQDRLDGRPAQDVASRHAVIRLHGDDGSRPVRIAVRIDSATALALDYRTMSEAELARIDRIDYALFGVLAGVILASAIYAAAIHIALRERIYLLFAGFALGNLGYLFFTEAYAYAFLPTDQRLLGNALGSFCGAAFSICIVQFVRDYLGLPELLPRFDRYGVLPIMWVVASVLVLFPLAPWLGNSVAAFGTVAGIFIIGIASILAARRIRPARSFVAAIVLFYLSGMIHLLKRAGVLPDIHSLSLLLWVGSAAAVVSFAMAVFERVRRIAVEKREAQQQHADRLERLVGERTAELSMAKESAERSLAQLQATQQQLLQSEKFASLGQLVAGVAHEVNTPLGIALTASSHLHERAHIVHVDMDQGRLKRPQLAGFLDEADQSSALIERNLDRAAQLIRSFKQVSVDRTSDGRRRFVLHRFLRELCDTLEPGWRRRPLTLQVHCPDGIELDSFPGALGQVVTNLIQNSLMHAFEPEQSGLMLLRVTRDGDEALRIDYIDDGHGVDAEGLRRMFEPFYTTRRNRGGTGLGLNIVYNLVVQKLGGRIEAEGAPGRGLSIRLQLPLVAPAAEIA